MENNMENNVGNNMGNDMKEKLKNLKLHQIAAILFGALAVFNVCGGILQGGGGFVYLLSVLIWTAGYGIIAYCLYKERRDILLVAGFCILAFVVLMEFIQGFRYGLYHVDSWYSGVRFSFFAMLPAFVNLAGYVTGALAVLALTTEYIPQQKEMAKKLWFLPAVIIMGTFVVALIVWFLFGIGLLSGWWFYARLYVSFSNIIGRIIVAAAFYLALTWIAHPDGIKDISFEPKKDAEGNVQYNIPVEEAAYCGLFKHTLLMLLTFGIWNLIWIYKRTAYLNRVEEEPKQTPVYQLLLCMFVPCYTIYWTYRNAQRLESYAKTKEVECEISLICLITSLAGTLIPSILMQEKLNDIIMAKPEQGLDETQANLGEKAKVGLVKHTLLYLLTFGIWNFIWIYRTTRELNVVNGESDRTPVNQLLLCMFVPFYMIYWYYVSAKRIDKLAHAKGVRSELETWTLILSYFAPVIPAILMQEKMNKLV